MRLFVAVRPPTDALAGIRDPHITLCFLGDVEDDAVPAVEAALRSGLVGVGACEAVVAGGRPTRLGPSAIVRAVSGLDDVALAVRRAVGRYAARPEDRPFRGHLTVARRRRGVPAPSDGAALEGADSPEVRWLADEVLLVRSELGKGPGGTAHHTVVAAVQLG